ncbi:MAG TPA: PfkB family carbohydrate kinase, partial [Kiloniellales bacterium]|nr:PfkB family carbohydrate kinase [Kiloniellales bacterium]
TRSEKGSVILADGEAHQVEAIRIGDLVDTTGAGDLYAAGFLYGYTQGRDLPTCGRLASLAAGEAVSHLGPRPSRSLAELVRSHGL